MRQLHVLGVSEDGATLLLGTTKNAARATHRISVDDRLRAAARGHLAAAGDRAEIALSPKEIQARLRAGATPEEVAKAAGVPVARVLPYFAPVEAERDRIVDQARAAVMHRHRGPDGRRPLGPAVDARLEETAGLKPETVAWTARRRPDGAWVVGVSYAARGGRRKAEWLWQPTGRDLSPLDPAASRLAADADSAPKRRTAVKAASRPAAKKPAARKTARRAAKPVAKRAAATKPASKRAAATRATKPVAAKPVAKRTAQPVAKPAATKRAATKPAATKPAATKRAATKRAATKPAATKATRPQMPEPRAGAEPPVATPLPVVEVVPDVVPVVTAPAAAAPRPQPVPPAPPRRPGQRVPLPSWSDVLLGVSGPREEAAEQTPPPAPRNGRRRAG